MNTIPGLWDVGPHTPFLVEKTWRQFVRQIGGTVVEDVLPRQPRFENADFYFPDTQIIAELKEIQTEFSQSQGFMTGFHELMERVVREDPAWKPVLLGGDGHFPPWFQHNFIRLFRPPVSRILKKANRQIRDGIGVVYRHNHRSDIPYVYIPGFRHALSLFSALRHAAGAICPTRTDSGMPR